MLERNGQNARFSSANAGISESQSILAKGLSDQDMFNAYQAAAVSPLWQIAYALHRQSLIDWQAHFITHHARAPDANELAAFLIGEHQPKRIAEYLARAENFDAPPGSRTPKLTEKPAKKPTKPIFAMGWLRSTPPLPERSGPAQNPAEGQAGLPWRAITYKFGLLLVAIILSALFMRQFVSVP
jgi:hypothetical protein